MKKSKQTKAEAFPKSYRYALRLTSEEEERFHSLLRASGLSNKSEFIRHRIFERPFQVITQDEHTLAYYARLTEIHEQIRKIGTLYNQTVRSINSYHSLKTARTLLIKLEQYTLKVIALLEEVKELTQALEEKCSHA